jgi:hypothetical protein
MTDEQVSMTCPRPVSLIQAAVSDDLITFIQEQICVIFGWTALAVVIGYIAYFAEEIRAYIASYYRSTYEVGSPLCQEGSTSF